MKRINRTLRLLAVAAASLGTLLSTAPAQAITVSITPSSQTISVGESASVDIVVSGLTQPVDAVGGFSLLLTFNDTFLSGVSFSPDPGVTMGAYDSNNDFSSYLGGGLLDLFYVANASEDQASLAALQLGSFTLARVSFTGAAPGLSPLTLSNVVLSNWDGTDYSADLTQNGTICVQAAGSTAGCPQVVPEPGTLALLSLGMLGMGLARRRRSA